MTDNTFPPKVEDDGTIRAGGLSFGQLTNDGKLVQRDRYANRCRARGTDDVAVDLVELMDAVMAYLRERG